MDLAYMEIDHRRQPYDALKGGARRAFHERLSLCWLYHDHALEGVPLSRDEIDRALDCKPARNYCDGEQQKSVRRLCDAIEYIGEEAREQRELSVEWIRDLHGRLCDDGSEAAGRYRQRDTSPGVYNLDIVPSNSISYHFHKFVDDAKSTFAQDHPVPAAAETHWEFMHVFPFDDRTGMVGRLLMNFLLMRAEYPPAVVHGQKRQEYFQALRGHADDLVPVLVDALDATIDAADEFDESDADREVPAESPSRDERTPRAAV